MTRLTIDSKRFIKLHTNDGDVLDCALDLMGRPFDLVCWGDGESFALWNCHDEARARRQIAWLSNLLGC